MKTQKSRLSEYDHPGCKYIFDLALEGDKMCEQVVDEFGYYLAYACANIAVTVNPEVFIIGGGVSKSGKQVTDAIEKYYRDFAFNSTKNTPFVIAKLGNDAGMVGAALFAKKL